MRIPRFTRKKLYRWHDHNIANHELDVGQHVLLYNSLLTLMPIKLGFRWSGPLDEPPRTLRASIRDCGNQYWSKCKVLINGNRIKIYHGGVVMNKQTTMDLKIPNWEGKCNHAIYYKFSACWGATQHYIYSVNLFILF